MSKLPAKLPAAFRKEARYQVGDSFIDNIGQGDHHCVVVAVDDSTGDYLFAYKTLDGKCALRNHNSTPVDKKRIPKKFHWRVGR